MNAEKTDVVNQKKGFNAIINRIKADPKIPLIIAGSAAIAIFVAAFLWLQSPDYKVLYSNLSDKDGGEIVTQLTQMNVPYRLSQNGAAIMVPDNQVHELRLKLAQAGLPKGGAAGFELLDKEKFGISQFSEQINYQRALEGELARTIETLGPVQNARVHLALPKPSLFVREQKSPSASVTVGLLQGRALDEGQINAIVHIVASSVAGMPDSSVTIVDQSGKLLTQPDALGRDLNSIQLKYVQELESRYQQRIETLLGPIVGRGNVHAQVTAQVDFSHTEETAEEYKPNQPPNQAAVRSKQLSQSEQNGGMLAGGVPGALSNQPVAPPQAPIETPKAQEGEKTDEANTTGTNRTLTRNPNSNSRLDETTNYEVDRRIRHIKRPVGNVERLSVAVIVNYKTIEDTKEAAEGEEPVVETKQIPLTDEQIQQIEGLVREAMGYSQERGDSLSVVNSQFNDTEEKVITIPVWENPEILAKALDLGRWLLLVIIAWILWRKLVKPQLDKRREAEIAAQKAVLKTKLQVKDDVDEAELDDEARRKQARKRVSAELQSQRIREMAEKDPRVVAMVIRQWMSKEQ
ncbi:flagellar M-ring protein FliF [Proteus vulgaris]|jgi:flagellar M-ring protein FliF|uniref:Flagellar M-ring protein n=1 Tax=Proteus vulgaris TaxID=585 RepID=A0A379FCA2_PROVU|nr:MULTISPECIES: flagellar basal-body MS-ring/collar protein FliF [Proteus]NBN60386.1 flagellar basal body M-ring protein FliF [Proteus sp. G2639]RNT28651.1 flagellar basal body M-ring protein FliF [Proteus mirabilis]KGA59978.1 flagellar M-ring protein FliF [Proteus vulgaris]MBG5972514.1 flagellar M-ring protein FliF [Proteus vulgaris]MBG5983885.1 flagellar M-ring protein FliF [Proteus vulgaris]